jgi:RNA polymerase sigma-70 factor (ECF subfamily)
MHMLLDPRGDAATPEILEGWRERLVAHAARVLGDGAEAEDVAQEVLLRAPEAARRADLRSLPAWLYAATYRAAVDRLRARRRRERAHAGRAGEGAGDDVPGALARIEDAARLRAAVAALGDPYGAAVRLRYLEGLEFADVAARLHTIERTARTWVGRGLAKLRERLGES